MAKGKALVSFVHGKTSVAFGEVKEFEEKILDELEKIGYVKRLEEKKAEKKKAKKKTDPIVEDKVEDKAKEVKTEDK